MTDELRLEALQEYVLYITAQGWGYGYDSEVPAEAGEWFCIHDFHVKFYLRSDPEVVRLAFAEAVSRGITGDENTPGSWYGYFVTLNDLNRRVFDCRISPPARSSACSVTINAWLGYFDK